MGRMRGMPGYDAVAQCSHVFIAATILLALTRLGVCLGLAFTAVVAWGVVKEFVYDLAVEGDTLAGSLEDFSWYIVGGFVTLVFCFLT